MFDKMQEMEKLLAELVSADIISDYARCPGVDRFDIELHNPEHAVQHILQIEVI